MSPTYAMGPGGKRYRYYDCANAQQRGWNRCPSKSVSAASIKRVVLGQRLTHIPLGVDTDKFRPAQPNERSEGRQLLGLADDEIVFLFVGRLTIHCKASPVPMLLGIAEAARFTGKRLHLLMYGRAINNQVRDAFLDAGRRFAPTSV